MAGRPADPPSDRAPTNLLVVGWYPAADDPITGRFVADQAAALAATGRVVPAVVSFEPLGSAGDPALRTRAADVWAQVVAGAAAGGRAFAPAGATGPSSVPVLRLGVTGGTLVGGGHPSGNQAVHRARALGAFLDAWAGPPWPLVHVHVGYPEGAAVAMVAAERDVPFVLTEHATYLARLLADPVQRALYGRAARAAARVIAVGSDLAAQIVAAFPDLGDRVVVIPNAVDIDAFPLTGPGQRTADELLYVGYRTAVKGVDTLLDAFATVHAARPATTLRLVGSSPDAATEKAWQRRAAGLGIIDAVRFEPAADRAGVARAMARAALFVHPSTRETFGVVAVEALASGLPVVAADSGGVTEILGREPARFGALVPPRDAAALAAAISTTLAERERFEPAVLRAWVADRYGAPAVASRLADLYEEVLAIPRASRARGSAHESPGTAVAGPGQPVVVVAFDRSALDRAVRRMPAWVVDGAVVVTCGSARPGWRIIGGRLGGQVARLIAARTPPAAGLAALPLQPIRALLHERRQAQLAAAVLPALTSAVRAAADQARGAGEAVVQLVCLGGLDVVAAADAADGRSVVAPGGLRWLADQRWTAARSGLVAPSSSSPA
ncbi:MAG TPA: glycosyltransferase [Candidatus Sulfotelmatobacter sp.]|nr:glycosyltransferase [Candidatus Sulfotelmatobacter sp.]